MRVLVVEDEILLAIDLVETLVDMGEEIIGPYSTVKAALKFLEDASVDFAILDFNLGRETSEVIADRLILKNIPFVFLTGYTRKGLPTKFAEIRILSKPFSETTLTYELERVRRSDLYLK